LNYCPTVLKLVHKVKRWWKGPGSGPSTLMPYAVECACGQRLTGPRLAVHQVVPCPRCGARLFIFPRSPLPFVPPSREGVKERSAAFLPARRRSWHLAAGVALLTVAVAGALLWLRPPGDTDTSPGSKPAAPDSLPDLESIRADLAQGKFHAGLAGARSLQDGGSLTLAERRALTQLRRQAQLMTDLLETPLQEILRDAVEKSSQGEWPAVLQQHYAGKAVVLDAAVRRTASGGLALEYYLLAGGRPARVNIGALDLVRGLGIDRRYRLIIGARLADVRREPSRVWVVDLKPDSGVLLTERGLLESACPRLRHDPGLAEVLRRQRRWLEELP
jgi:hypothetical protein